jgi:hypothetical protein
VEEEREIVEIFICKHTGRRKNTKWRHCTQKTAGPRTNLRHVPRRKEGRKAGRGGRVGGRR